MPKNIDMHRQNISIFGECLVVVAVALMFSLLWTTFLLGPKIALAHTNYFCLGHCYGVTTWGQANAGWSQETIGGTGTSIKIAPMVCSGYCQVNNHLNNETWLEDVHSNNGCPNYGLCWIEVGYQDRHFGSPNDHIATVYFWSDIRPINGGYARDHYLNGVQSHDYGSTIDVAIQITNSNTGSWQVYMCAPSYCPSTDNQSIGNHMNPNNIVIGEEIEGTVGSSQASDFTQNYWITTNGTSAFETTLGQESSNNPPHEYWYIQPHSLNNGGDLRTNCC